MWSGAWLLSYQAVAECMSGQTVSASHYKIRVAQQMHGVIDFHSWSKGYHFLLGWMDTTKKSWCVDGELTLQLGVLSCIVTAQTCELMGVDLRDKYIKHNAEVIVLIVNHEQTTTVFVLLPELLLPPQRSQELHKVVVPVYWISLMPFMTRVEVLDAHVQWNPGRFWSTMSGEHKTYCTE